MPRHQRGGARPPRGRFAFALFSILSVSFPSRMQ
ncbi:hypothetical protein CMEL01_16633 [Colletotrichum melonis]|uniref:Uncharacterized protein n=1 Tax=Colletotrichum melonis TaxID=1209925 RepID=A0AAI9XN34_9PEZI|nr:hypothetical protein CMEL01_16633 [Colletotrichum melonis]